MTTLVVLSIVTSWRRAKGMRQELLDNETVRAPATRATWSFTGQEYQKDRNEEEKGFKIQKSRYKVSRRILHALNKQAPESRPTISIALRPMTSQYYPLTGWIDR